MLTKQKVADRRAGAGALQHAKGQGRDLEYLWKRYMGTALLMAYLRPPLYLAAARSWFANFTVESVGVTSARTDTGPLCRRISTTQRLKLARKRHKLSCRYV